MYELNVLTYKIWLTFPHKSKLFFMVKEGKSDPCSCSVTLYHWFINLCIKYLEKIFVVCKKKDTEAFHLFPFSVLPRMYLDFQTVLYTLENVILNKF